MALFIALLSLLQLSAAAAEERWIQGTDMEGTTRWLKDTRKPSLYTGKYGDCMGSSNIKVTRFDAAYYRDNMTVLFHLAGETATDDALMSRFTALPTSRQLPNS